MSKLQALTYSLIAVLAAVPAAAQFAQRGSITGTVADQSGGVVPGAKISLTDLDQRKTTITQTNESGQYAFTQLNTGHYQVGVEATGMQQSVSTPIELATQQNAKFDFTLVPGAVVQAIEVRSAEPLVETDRASVDENIDFQQIQALPINGRNYTSLAALAPGIATYPQSNVNPGGTYNVGGQHVMGGTQYAVGGQFEGTPGDNGYYVNGVNATENYQGGISYAPSIDAIQEARLAVSDFSAATGHDISTFSISTRAGTNQFHGQAFDYLENDLLNARVPFQEDVGLFAKPTLRRNQFGGGLGGPVVIPKLYHKLKDRAFFFVNWEQWEERDGLPNTTAFVPSDAERAGNFGELCTAGFDTNGMCTDPTQQLYNPTTTTYDHSGNSTRSIFPFNKIGPVDPGAAAILGLYPHENSPGSVANGFNYVTSATHGASVYRLDSRYDYRISDKNSLFVAFSRSRGTDNNTGGVFPQYVGNVDDRSYVITINDAHTFTPNIANELIVGFSHAALVTVSPSELAFVNSSANPFNSIFSNTGNGTNKGSLALYMYGQYADPGFFEIFQAANLSRQVSDNLSWVHGKHYMTFGMNYFNKGEQDWDFNRFASFGCQLNYITFTCPKDEFTQAGSAQGSGGGDAFADLMLGLPRLIHQRYDVTSGGPLAPQLDLRFPYWGFYANDRMQLSEKLTLSVGLRYDLIIPIFAPNNLCCALVNENVPGWELQVPGIAPGVPQHFLSPVKDYFAPRVSVAYRIKPRLVFRVGYGLFYDEGGGQISSAVGNALNGIPGYFVGEDVTNATLGAPNDTPALHLSNIFPAAPAVAPGTYPVNLGKGTGLLSNSGFGDVYTFNKESNTVPHYHRYLADLQYEVSKDSVLTLEFVGAQGRNGMYFAGSNLPPYQVNWPDGAFGDAFNAARPNNTGNFGTVWNLAPGLKTFYNAGVVKFEKRFSNGFSILSNYSFSKTVATRASVGGGDAVWAYNLNGSEGLATSDHPQRFVFSAVWQPVYGRTWNPVARTLLAGWQISTVTTMESGDRYAALNYSGTSANNANGPDLMSINPGANPNVGHGSKTFYEQFNTNAFYAPANGVIGGAAPGIIQGPGQINSDISAAKTFNLTERFKLDFRSDFLNALNHPQWTGISNYYPADPNTGVPFGQVEGSREGRIIQVSAKVHF